MKAISKNGQIFEVIAKASEKSVWVKKEDGTQTIIMLPFNPLFDEKGNSINLSLLETRISEPIAKGDKVEKRNDEFAAYMSEKSEIYIKDLKKYGK